MLTRQTTPIQVRPTTVGQEPVHSEQVGFVLMDVLISILLFSVGVLALIGLQGAMTRSQTEAKIRADASYLANTMAGQIRSNAAQLASYTASGCPGMGPCKEWQDTVAATLPNGVGTVDVSTTDTHSPPLWGDVTITITWTLPNGDTHKYVTQTSITNNPIE